VVKVKEIGNTLVTIEKPNHRLDDWALNILFRLLPKQVRYQAALHPEERFL